MLLDIMSPYSYLQVNTKMITIFGLNTAAYWAELLNIYPRVIKKKKDEVLQANGFFNVDREYIKARTSLDLSEQTKCDKALVNVGALMVDESDPNRICISLNTMFEILSEDDTAELLAIQKKAKVKKTKTVATKQDMIKFNLKKAITVQDTELREAYEKWIDSVTEKKYLTKAAVEIFIRNVNEYSNSKAVQLKVIEIATIKAYDNAEWAINLISGGTKKPGTFIGVAQKQNVGIDPNSVF
jgi:hypothetical protein